MIGDDMIIMAELVDSGTVSRSVSLEGLRREGISCEPACDPEDSPPPETKYLQPCEPSAFLENGNPWISPGVDYLFLTSGTKIDEHWTPSPGDSEKLQLIEDPEQMMRVLRLAQPFLRRAKDQKDFVVYPVIERALDSCLKLISTNESSTGSFLNGKDVNAVRVAFRKQFLDVVVSCWTSYQKFKKQVDYLLRKGSKF